MKKVMILLVLSLAAIACFGQTNLFSELPEVPGFAPTFAPGAWVEYKIFNDKGEPGLMKFSILSTEERRDGQYFWFEMKNTDLAKDDWVITKFLAVDPKNRDGYVSMIIQRKGEPAREITLKGLMDRVSKEKPSDKPKAKEEEPTIEVKKDVEVTVPAGSFTTDEFIIVHRGDKFKTWISGDVPILGIVKGEGQAGKLELKAYGKENAVSEITGEVEKVEMPNLRNLLKSVQPDEE